MVRDNARRVFNAIKKQLNRRMHWWASDYPRISIDGKQEIRRHCSDLLDLTGNTIFGGPFAGMKVPAECKTLRAFPAALVGSYEEEIHDIINQVISEPPDTIIDIGSAQGLYLVGFAINISKSRIIGFEINENACEEALQLAKANGIGHRIEQKGLCTIDSLAEVCEPGSFILCDCEGAESKLLDPVVIEALQSCQIVCELHDRIVPGITADLVERFRKTHHIEIRCEKPKMPESYRVLRSFPKKIRSVMCDETRHISHPFSLCSGRYMVLQPKL